MPVRRADRPRRSPATAPSMVPIVEGLSGPARRDAIPLIASGGVGTLDHFGACWPRCRAQDRAWRGDRGTAPPPPRVCFYAATSTVTNAWCMEDPLMFVARVIPCLDVDAGRVVKGVNFVGLRDAGIACRACGALRHRGPDEFVPRHHRIRATPATR